MDLKNQAAARIQGRISADRLAEEMTAAPVWEDHTGSQYCAAFVRRLTELLPIKKEDVRKPDPGSPVAALGLEVLRHNGEHLTYDEVEITELHSHLASLEKVVASLKAYLSHPSLYAHRVRHGNGAE